MCTSTQNFILSPKPYLRESELNEGNFQGNMYAWDGLSKNIEEPKLNIQLVSTYLFYISNTS